MTAREDFRAQLANQRFATILADPPWRFQDSTGKVSPRHRRFSRYGSIDLFGIM